MNPLSELIAIPREWSGSNKCRLLRRHGQIPAVVYQDRQSRAISLEQNDVAKLLRNQPTQYGTIVVKLRMEGDRNVLLAMLKAIDKAVIGDRVEHIDFQVIDKSKAFTARIPIHAIGKPRGEIRGGLLQTLRRYVEIKCLPEAIPSILEVDVTGLDVGQSLHVKDLQLPTGTSAVSRATDTLYSVKTTRGVIEEEGEVESASTTET